MKTLLIFILLSVGLFAQSGGAGAIAISQPPPSSGPGSGDVVGPASSTDNAVARFDGTTGKLLQNSAVTIADTTGAIAGANSLTSQALSPLTLGTGTFGTAVSFASATGLPTFTAAPSAPSYTSTVATGTAPLTVASTTLVANLHAATADSATASGTVTVVDDTTTNATMYPTWVTTTTGNLPAKVSSTKLTFNPSTSIIGIADGGGITSAGSIDLTAGSTSKNVSLIPSDPGAQGAVTTRAAYSSQTIIGTGGLQVVKQAVSGAVFPSVELIGYQNGQTAQMFVAVAKAGGTSASPTTATANATVGGYRFYARANGAWNNVGNWSIATSSTFGDSDFSSTMSIGPSSSGANFNAIQISGGDATTGVGKSLSFGAVATTTTAPTTMFYFDNGGNFSRPSAWGTTGANSAWIGRTITDTASSGTVATAVANSFAVPTFAASSATTFTDVFNLYAAGPVAAGTNVTRTRPHTLGVVDSTSAASSITGGFIVAAALGTTATSTGIGGGNINTGGTLTTGGAVTVGTTISSYNGLATAGNGVASIQGSGRVTAQNAAAASVMTYTLGASDASFLVSANVNVTTATAHSFTMTCAYTDEGNTARTITLTFSNVAGTLLNTITNVTGAGPYEGVPLHIRCKASTAVTLATTGTFTTVTYNAEGNLTKLQ